jgi:hypothetical protein
MATNKANRSVSLAQIKRRRSTQQTGRQPISNGKVDQAANQHTDPQLKAYLMETLRHLNRGFGVALAAFDRLGKLNRLQKVGIFTTDSLIHYRHRTEELRALANRDLLNSFAGREELEAQRFGRLSESSGRHSS